MSELKIDLTKISQNAALIAQRASTQGVHVYGVTKVLSGAWQVAAVFKQAGISAIADSRLENIAAMRRAGVPGPYVLLRLPRVSEATQVVSLADISLISELSTCEALSQAALEKGLRHKVIVMIDLGDLREGLWPSELGKFLKQAKQYRGIEIYGLGTNLTCYGGVIPDENNLGQLVRLKEEAQDLLGYELLLSGGNSSSLSLLFSGKLPAGINNLRLGEGIILGRETINREPLPQAHLDACVLSAEVIELYEKPSVPVGIIGQDAFGNAPQFVDNGLRKRAILALGRQDTVPEGLEPLLPGCTIIGASSDHLIVDVSDCSPTLRVGDTLEFGLGYGALLLASTSPYVTKTFVGKV